MLTQCPDCHTVFRVTDAQLDIANGKVRCGRCKHVFNARDHFQQTVKELEEQNPPSVAPPQADNTPSTTTDTASEETDVAIQTDFDLSGLDSVEMQRNLDTLQAESVAFAAVNAIEAELAFLDKDAVTTQQELAAASAIAINKAEIPPPQHNPAIAEGLARFTPLPETEVITALELPAWQYAAQAEAIIHELRPLTPRIDHINIGPWQTAALSEALLWVDVERPAIAEPLEKYPLPESDIPNAAIAESIIPVIHHDQAAPENGNILAPELLYPELTDVYEPVQVSIWDKPMIRAVAASVVLITLLVLQGMYVFRDDFAKVASLQPIVTKMCELTGCTLTVQRQPDLVRFVSRNIFSHPETKNALMMTAVIENRDNAVQPYPVLQITFRDLKQQLVAVRRFYAHEYLPEDLIAENGMTPQQPVNIVLQLVDPGKRAVSFTFDLL